MNSFCDSSCCSECGRLSDCGGCEKTDGRPFGGECVAAKCVKAGGKAAFEELKNQLIDEINALKIDGLSVDSLNLLNGFYVNLEYPLANGTKAKFLEDNKVYLGNQIERSGCERCYGVVADETMIIVCEYGCMGENPVLLRYIKR